MATQAKPVQQLTPFGYALAGALGGCFSTAVVYPLDVVKTRIQASSADAKGKGKKNDLTVLSLLLRILKEEGIWGYYRGFAATMVNTFSMQYAYFFFYSLVRTSYIKRLSRKLPAGSKAPALSTAAELILGAIAGALAQIFTIPVSVIATRQQIGHSFSSGSASSIPPEPLASTSELEGKSEDKKDVKEEEYDDSFFGVAREIVKEEGVTGLWLGLRPGLVLTVNPAITYGAFERVKSIILLAREKTGGSGKLTPGLSFVIGALSKTLATVVTYPYIMAKVRIQARTADADEDEEHHLPPPPHNKYHHEKDKHVGAVDVLVRVYKKQGFVGWYQGMGAQITKAVLSQALLFMSKDQFEQWALSIMMLYYSLGRS